MTEKEFDHIIDIVVADCNLIAEIAFETTVAGSSERTAMADLVYEFLKAKSKFEGKMGRSQGSKKMSNMTYEDVIKEYFSGEKPEN